MDYFYAELFGEIGLDWLSTQLDGLGTCEDVRYLIYDKVALLYSRSTSTLTDSEDAARSAFLAAIVSLGQSAPKLGEGEHEEYVAASMFLIDQAKSDVPLLSIP